ncbi:MAG: tetratricopeptide repeat protein [Chitinophagaceae bacterium]|nr:tetratricopeptide repeat protein [Chitinophagaceae bacterium]
MKRIIFFLLFIITTINITLAQDFYKKQIAKADSLFMAQNWASAKSIYEKVSKDTVLAPISWVRAGFSNYNLRNYDDALVQYKKALTLKPAVAAMPIIYARMAKVYAIKNQKEDALVALDSAISNGYIQFLELDTLNDFNNLRNEDRFKKIRSRVYTLANPCMSDPHHREFDFWVGEWNVFQTAGMVPTGAQSKIQMISGGCAILENWESPASNGKSINFIDPVTNKWKQSWVGNYVNGTQEFINGEYREGAMHYDFTTVSNGQKLMGHLIFYNQGPNQVRQFNEVSADGGKTWTTSYDFTYVRKK